MTINMYNAGVRIRMGGKFRELWGHKGTGLKFREGFGRKWCLNCYVNK